MIGILSKLRVAVVQAMADDVINTAKAVAYSGMLMMFPALLVMTTLLAQVPEGNTLMGAVRATFEQLLPPTPWTCFSLMFLPAIFTLGR